MVITFNPLFEAVTVSMGRLYHVGSLDPSQKRPFSHEGSSGLSVTSTPDAWRHINRGFTAGDTHSFDKPGNQFLDYHRLNDRHWKLINQWGVEYGYLTPATKYRFSYYDDELEAECYQEFSSRDEAEQERPDEDCEITSHDGFVVTPAFKKEYGTQDPEMIAAAYAREVLKLDGVWWEDDFSVVQLSAPRGLIFNTALKSFAADQANSFDMESALQEALCRCIHDQVSAVLTSPMERFELIREYLEMRFNRDGYIQDPDAPDFSNATALTAHIEARHADIELPLIGTARLKNARYTSVRSVETALARMQFENGERNDLLADDTKLQTKAKIVRIPLEELRELLTENKNNASVEIQRLSQFLDSDAAIFAKAVELKKAAGIKFRDASPGNFSPK